jgi:hypothetical protein
MLFVLPCLVAAVELRKCANKTHHLVVPVYGGRLCLQGRVLIKVQGLLEGLAGRGGWGVGGGVMGPHGGERGVSGATGEGEFRPSDGVRRTLGLQRQQPLQTQLRHENGHVMSSAAGRTHLVFEVAVDLGVEGEGDGEPALDVRGVDDVELGVGVGWGGVGVGGGEEMSLMASCARQDRPPHSKQPPPPGTTRTGLPSSLSHLTRVTEASALRSSSVRNSCSPGWPSMARRQNWGSWGGDACGLRGGRGCVPVEGSGVEHRRV